MKYLKPINRNLFDLYALFTREPFLNFLAAELEFYSDGNGLIGVILLDHTDQDYSAVLMSRDESKQYRAESIEASFKTIEDARKWLDKVSSSDRIFEHENKSNFFDLFTSVASPTQRHPFFEFLKDNPEYQAAKEAIQEISYHYKDIDGNFIDQFQSLNGFDARLWELFLFCFCREEEFHFNKTKDAPDFLIEKFGVEIAIEAVTISRNDNSRGAILEDAKNPLSESDIKGKLENEMQLKYANALTSKLKKQYWKKDHVKNKALVIAVADFHATLSMTWSFPALLDYIYGLKISHEFDNDKNLNISYRPIEGFTKPNGTVIPAGFFTLPESENISAVLFSNAGTISKFNRMGKQAGLGSEKSKLIRSVLYHDHSDGAVVPLFSGYEVDETSGETWAEGVHFFHNPNALIKIDPNLFPSIAHHFLIDGKIKSIFPEFFPYSSVTKNLVFVDSKMNSDL
jgi:hypothetical protein